MKNEKFPTQKEIYKSRYQWLVNALVSSGVHFGDALRDVGKMIIEDRRKSKTKRKG